jgi:UDP-N-acetylmuramoyl-tripeptide--D-alanyl-D-alanine ligase
LGGAVGKTTTKDLLAAALARRFPVGASPRSFNNELGVPLSLLSVPAGAKAVVVEMGTGGVGEIARHCELAEPCAGIVTRVAPAHLETLRDLAGVARAKAELVEALPGSGLAVLNADDPWGVAEVRLAARGEHQVGNALAAAALALAWGVPLDQVTAALEQAPLSPGRMQPATTAPSGRWRWGSASG